MSILVFLEWIFRVFLTHWKKLLAYKFKEVFTFQSGQKHRNVFLSLLPLPQAGGTKTKEKK
jgi:hypothetical protein